MAALGNPADAAVASSLAAQLYGLDILAPNVEDAPHNTTRFYITAAEPHVPPPAALGTMTTFVFHSRNVPAALYKCLGGFATKRREHDEAGKPTCLPASCTATQFLCDVEGHPEHANLVRAMEELAFFSQSVKVLGVYPAAPFRKAAPRA